MSPAHREMVAAILDAQLDQIIEDITAARRLTREAARAAVDRAPFSAAEALALGLGGRGLFEGGRPPRPGGAPRLPPAAAAVRPADGGVEHARAALPRRRTRAAGARRCVLHRF